MDSIRELAFKIAGFIDDKKGLSITLLDVRGLCSITDYFVIATGTSNRHVHALADGVEDGMDRLGQPLRHKEGHRQGDWIILDYMDVVVHLFQKETRDFYSLERIWRDARHVELAFDRLDTQGKSL